MIYNMLYIKLNLTSMISEAIGRFFPGLLVSSRDSKMGKTRSNVRENWISNTLNVKAKTFRKGIQRKWLFAYFNPWWISWPYYKVLENWRKCCSRYLWYINDPKVQNTIQAIEFEIMTFCCFWRDLLKLQLMTSSLWLIDFDLRNVKVRPNSYDSRREN